MAEQKNKEPEGVGQEIETEGGEVRFEPVKKIEEDTFDAVKSLKTFIFITIGLLVGHFSCLCFSCFQTFKLY